MVVAILLLLLKLSHGLQIMLLLLSVVLVRTVILVVTQLRSYSLLRHLLMPVVTQPLLLAQAVMSLVLIVPFQEQEHGLQEMVVAILLLLLKLSHGLQIMLLLLSVVLVRTIILVATQLRSYSLLRHLLMPVVTQPLLLVQAAM